ncbi:hypothetical protein [Amycolatopsis sp. 195334CR]|uniref:hypothetical protein n=1 Tax=Amycolatopsis sp. 195334CR TaxID=2814588 RepID=UPI001A8C65C4|nr:hypothetical protein [Amycolatopsis sp. 195334CR]MBN6034758.1 hypothetical protein [Amycolatopsis sp. 195334CR]
MSNSVSNRITITLVAAIAIGKPAVLDLSVPTADAMSSAICAARMISAAMMLSFVYSMLFALLRQASAIWRQSFSSFG